MSNLNHIRPPRWMDRIIELYCRPELLEDLQGDLHEYYERNIDKGRFKANLIFFLDVIKFCRLYTVRKPKILGQMTFISIFSNYLKTSVRSLARNKLFSSINIIGLAISMSIGILMITYISELLSFDVFHAKKDRIYRVLSTYEDLVDGDTWELASTSVFIGKKIQEEYAGVEKAVIMRRNFRDDLNKGDNAISVRGLYSTTEFFDVFSFKLKSGNPATALAEPNSLILTARTAKKLFGDKDPVGEQVKGRNRDYTISGVLEDIPANSHIQFEALLSFITIENEQRNNENSTFFTWRSMWINHVYVLLNEGQNPKDIDASIQKTSDEENAKTDRYAINYYLDPMLDAVPGKELSNQIGRSMTWKSIYQLVFLTLIVIISACFNYTNLSIARSLRRAKEVGVRKIVGASRRQVFIQFVFEAVLIAVIASVLAFGLFLFLKPSFINMVLDNDMVNLEFKWTHLIYFFLFAVVIGFVAGAVPSMFLSKLKAISILRDVTKVKLFKGLSLRKVLIVFQFVISIALIIGANIAYKQYMFSLNYDLGFRTENILNLQLSGNDSKLLMNEVSKLPEVTSISRSGMIPNTGEIWGEEVKYKDPLDSVNIFINYVDKNYFDVHEYTFLAGGTFPFDVEEGETKFIVIDDQLRKRFGFETPESALGEIITVDFRLEDRKLEVAGVVKDFQYVKIESESEPVGILQGTKDDYQFLNLVVKTDNVLELMSKLESIWTSVDKLHPFEATFYDELIQQAYSDYEVLYKIFTFLGFLAISISCMGLLGMAVFTTETRIKEISVRKVLGASETNLVFLLSKGFVSMLVIASLIAMPLAYFFFENVVMVDNVKRIVIGPVELLSGVVLIFVIGLLTITWQTYRAARTNPAEMLRNE